MTILLPVDHKLSPIQLPSLFKTVEELGVDVTDGFVAVVVSTSQV
jgi:hypothetical protein